MSIFLGLFAFIPLPFLLYVTWHSSAISVPEWHIDVVTHSCKRGGFGEQ